MFIVLVPSLGAALVAGSRIMDARHHPFDVISGSLIGILIAWIAYRQYFPSISDFRAKGRAHPMRTWGKGPMGRGEHDEYDYQQPIPHDEDAMHSSGAQFTEDVELLQRKQKPSVSQRQLSQSPTTLAPSSQQLGSTIVPVLQSEPSDGDSTWKNLAKEEDGLEQKYTLSSSAQGLYDPATSPAHRLSAALSPAEDANSAKPSLRPSESRPV
jgi:PAP2 superfamily